MQDNNQRNQNDEGPMPIRASHRDGGDENLTQSQSDSALGFQPKPDSLESQAIYVEDQYYSQRNIGDGELPTMPMQSYPSYPTHPNYLPESHPQPSTAGQPYAQSHVPASVAQPYGQYPQYHSQYQPQQYEQQQQYVATSVYQPVISNDFAAEESKKNKNSIVLIVIAVVLTLFLIAGVIFGLHSFGYLGGTSKKPVAVATETSSAVPSENAKTPFQSSPTAIEKSIKPTPVATPTASSVTNLNIPDPTAETVAPGVKRLSQGSTQFVKAIAAAVNSRPFVANESYNITVYSEVVKKNFNVACNAPSSNEGWIHCTGVDTSGNVQVWVQPLR